MLSIEVVTGSVVVLSLSSPVAVDCRADFFAESVINEFAFLIFGIFLVIAVAGGCNWNASVPPILVDEKLCIRIRAADAVATDNIELVSFRIRILFPTIALILSYCILYYWVSVECLASCCSLEFRKSNRLLTLVSEEVLLSLVGECRRNITHPRAKKLPKK